MPARGMEALPVRAAEEKTMLTPESRRERFPSLERWIPSRKHSPWPRPMSYAVPPMSKKGKCCMQPPLQETEPMSLSSRAAGQAKARMARARMAAAASTWRSSTHSSAPWACWMEPGPNTTDGMPARASLLASVP
jgi:hypothetical protein